MSQHQSSSRSASIAPEGSTHNLEYDINKWREFCVAPDMTNSKWTFPGLQNLQSDYRNQHKLVEKMLQERQQIHRKHKEIASKNDKLDKLAEKQQMEINRLRQQRRRVPAKPKKQVHAYLYNPQQDHTLPMSDITSRLREVLLSRNIQFLPQVIETSPLTERARPVILPCVNVSRLGTDVSNALRDVKAGRDVAVVVLHHKDIHVLPKLSSEKTLTGAEFQSLGAIVDMAFWKEKGLHQCDINQKAIVQLADFLAHFVVS